MQNNDQSLFESKKKQTLEKLIAILKERVPESASLFHRSLAFLFDFILLSLLSMTLIIQFIIPEFYVQEWAGFQKFIAFEISNQSINIAQYLRSNPELRSMFADINLYFFLFGWAYFLVNEIMTKGSSFGKKIFQITIIKKDSIPTLFDYMLRSGIKSFTIFKFFPIFIFNFTLAFFTRNKQAGHDLICKTFSVYSQEKKEDPIVIEDEF